jgi:hypothetical protein
LMIMRPRQWKCSSLCGKQQQQHELGRRGSSSGGRTQQHLNIQRLRRAQSKLQKIRRGVGGGAGRTCKRFKWVAAVVSFLQDNVDEALIHSGLVRLRTTAATWFSGTGYVE